MAILWELGGHFEFSVNLPTVFLETTEKRFHWTSKFNLNVSGTVVTERKILVKVG